ncbi:MAG TPA: acyl-CoA dehydrogenase family protein [Burkholderiales bacterium]|nr:acyl-CoA dehydrogenase family protein [Burkholderiales bacterium]
MDLNTSPEDEAFRQEVRTFLRENLSPKVSAEIHRLGYLAHGRERMLDWHRILYKKGWAAPHWPKEYGGTGWTDMQKHIFEEECWKADAPVQAISNLSLVGPVIYTYGSPELKARFLPPILKGDIFFAQGFSEPNAGSDLAALKTTARLEGDHYVVNGSKIWTSGAHFSDWGFFLVRTNTEVKAQKGISFLLIDLKTPGITLRPIWSIDGMHHLNQTFLDNVRVPKENLVGEEGKGWDYGKFLLENERTSSAFINYSKREWEKARDIAKNELKNGRPLIEDPEFSRRLARVQIELQALEYSVLRVLSNEKSRFHTAAVAAVLKLHGSELQQKVTELQVEALGPKAVRAFNERQLADPSSDPPGMEPYVAGRTAEHLISRAATIYGGSQQVQRGLIAKLAFGL